MTDCLTPARAPAFNGFVVTFVGYERTATGGEVFGARSRVRRLGRLGTTGGASGTSGHAGGRDGRTIAGVCTETLWSMQAVQRSVHTAP
jgi:hypothetical protein